MSHQTVNVSKNFFRKYFKPLCFPTNPNDTTSPCWLYQLTSPPIHLHQIFEISSLKNLFRRTGFFSISNQIFAGYAGSKNLVGNRQKIQFDELDFQTRDFKITVQMNTSYMQLVAFTCQPQQACTGRINFTDLSFLI